MAVITFGSSSGQAGTSVSVTLTKSELVEIVSKPFYEDQSVWNKVYAIISNGKQQEQVDVTSGSGTFQTSTVALRGTWTLTSINIIDNDGGVERVTSGFTAPTFTVIGPDQPTISAPTNGATGVTLPFSITTSAYNVTGAANDTHTQSDFVVKDASDTTIFSSRNDASNLETISVTTGSFATSTTYYARARHEGGTYGNSPWSDSVSFTTADSFILPGFAHYDFTDGNLTNDSSVNSYTLTNNNSVTSSVDGAVFTGTGDSQIGVAPCLTEETTLLDSISSGWDLAIETYFKINSMPTAEFDLFCKDNIVDTDLILFRILSDGTGRFRAYSGGGTQKDTSTGFFTTATWYHLVVLWSRTQGSLVYLDGSEVTALTTSGNTTLMSDGTYEPLTIGAGYNVGNAGPQYGMNGVIKYFRIYNDDLTSGEVATLYANR